MPTLIARSLTLLSLLFLCGRLEAVTLHMQMTPEIAGTNAVLMKPSGANRTRFSIPCSTTDAMSNDARFPLVRGGTLAVYGKDGLIARCPLQPRRGANGSLVFSFELQNDVAKRSVFTLSVSRDDGQVGGGSIYSYRLIDFIDPGHRQKAMIHDIEKSRQKMLQDLRKLELPRP